LGALRFAVAKFTTKALEDLMLLKPSFVAGVTLIASTIFNSNNVRADEGMWQPPQLPSLANQLAQRGLALDPQKVSTLTSWPLDAVVSLGFCTASFISPDGLIVTNHHCGYFALQYNSTSEKNLINDGFLARAKGDELTAGPTQRVYVTDMISDVTKQINAALKPDRDGYARYVAIDQAKKRLVQDCEQPGYRCDVYTFSGGFDYQLIRQKELRDIRLVYAPPLSIGKYGGDVDNWMWPRHTGDFSFLRAYVAKDGSSASYSKDNVPYRPKHWLTVNQKGVRAGDFVMVAGYPGRTNRNRLADELQSAIDWQYPTEIGINTDLLAMIDTAGKSRPDVGVKYAGLVATLNNSMKFYQGNLDGLSRSHALAVKRSQEAALDQWLQQKPGGTLDGAKLQSDVATLHRLVAEHLKLRERDLVLQTIQRVGLFHASYQIVRLAEEKQKPDLAREEGFQKRDEVRLLGQQQGLDRQFDSAMDQQIFVYGLQRYVKLPPDQRLPALDRWLDGASDQSALAQKVAALYAGSKLTHTATRVSMLSATPTEIDASNDTWIKLMHHLMPDLIAREHEEKTYLGNESAARAGYMAALVAFNASRGLPVYHDANSSLRVTFGRVQGYKPRDAVEYMPFTTVDGIVQKSTGVEPFNAPAAELTAIRAKSFDGFAVSKKSPTLPVDFLADLDIAGGNSGSPVMDRNGQLVGLAFDGNWEGVSSGWVFNPKETRSIQVDVRYMLWVMHHLDHADNLLNEMQVTTMH
jgi:V8-like Glu-specific endopeptidase